MAGSSDPGVIRRSRIERDAPKRKIKRRRRVLQTNPGELPLAGEDIAFELSLKEHHTARLSLVQSSPGHSLGRDLEIIPAQRLFLPRLRAADRLSDDAPVHDFDPQPRAARAGRVGPHQDIADPFAHEGARFLRRGKRRRQEGFHRHGRSGATFSRGNLGQQLGAVGRFAVAMHEPLVGPPCGRAAPFPEKAVHNVLQRPLRRDNRGPQGLADVRVVGQDARGGRRRMREPRIVAKHLGVIRYRPPTFASTRAPPAGISPDRAPRIWGPSPPAPSRPIPASRIGLPARHIGTEESRRPPRAISFLASEPSPR